MWVNNIILWMTVCVFGNRIHNYDNHRVHSVPTKHFSNPNDVPDSLERDHQMKHFVAHKQNGNHHGQQQSRDIIPNMTITMGKDSYFLRHKGVHTQPLMIRRAPNATIGEPWPLPQKIMVNESRVFKVSNELKVKIRNNTCDILENAIHRFRQNLRYSVEEFYSNLVNIDGSGFENLEKKYAKDIYQRTRKLDVLHIHVNTACQRYPSIESDETYTLLVRNFGIVLMSKEIWGAIRGLETLSHLIFSWKNEHFVRETAITDFPRFKHRGVLIDSARHFMTKDVIFDILEGMYQNKMNVLHWHMVDDQSFTFESKVFPELSKKGAFHPTLVYTQNDIREVIEFARLRGIRVIPELDTPGHVYSWAMGHPEVLTDCYGPEGKIPGYYGPLNPARNFTYEFLKLLFMEVFDVFPERIVHLGGDEVPMECWNTNPEVKRLLDIVKKNTYGIMPMKPVWEWYTNRLLKLLKDLRKKNKKDGEFILWEEASKYDLNIPKDTIIQIWMGGGIEVRKAINKGFRVLFSSCWYLDHFKYGVHWQDYYSCDPTHHLPQLKKVEDKILGGEVCLWSEYITSETAMSSLWPRASAAAERLWSSYNQVDQEYAGRRLQEQRCRMLRRGLRVGHINGPDYCILQNHRNNHLQSRTEYTETIHYETNTFEPFIVGLSFSVIGAIFLFLFILLRFKSRVFVICWTFR